LIKPNGKEKGFLVQLFGFTKTADEVQKLSGGAPQLNSLLGDYRKRIANCKLTPQQPTILVVDNDLGPQDLFKHLGKILKKAVDGSEPFYWAYGNLYVVPVPKIAGAHIAMEDLLRKNY
jgi:RNA-directed DNA polymerase